MTSLDALMYASVVVSSHEQLMATTRSNRYLPKPTDRQSRIIKPSTWSSKPIEGCLPSMKEFLECSQHRQPTRHDRDPDPSRIPAIHTAKIRRQRERWTEREHALFMKGLLAYGRKWKKIQTLVQTKTVVQVRTHAYGYFAKLLRNIPECWRSSDGPACRSESGCAEHRCKTAEAEHRKQVLEQFVFRNHISK
uniref:Uncharacterized protein AlNc14C40G3464 n=1 Tax=Albugo laibachii Nc14 TaxID=890382 RepID=F0W9K9_9STRA|nr:conserved hypothetical protein [Albugo laibachii Nc14]|eukprot:CCA17827.1 conserved hypothetical protein [Albugo laibachii Nc14]